MSLVRKSFALAAAQGIAFALGLVNSIVVARALGPSGRGLVFVAVAASQLLFAVTGSALITAVSYNAGKQRHSVGLLVSTCIALAALLGVACDAILVVAFPLLQTSLLRGLQPAQIAVLCVFMPTLLAMQLLTGLFVGLGRAERLAVTQIMVSVSGLLLVILAALFAPTVTWMLAATMATYLVGALLLGRAALSGEERLTLRGIGGAARDVLRYAGRSYAGLVASQVWLRLDTFLLNAWFPAFAVGQYGVATNVAEKLPLALNSVGSGTFAAVTSGSREEAAELSARAARITLTLGVTVAVFVGVASVFLVPVLYGASFTPAVIPLIALLPGTVALSTGNVLTGYFSGQLGRPGINSAVSVVTGIAAAGLYVLLIPRLGPLGAALGSSLSYTLWLSIFIVLLARTGLVRLRDIVLPQRSDIEVYRRIVAGVVIRVRRPFEAMRSRSAARWVSRSTAEDTTPVLRPLSAEGAPTTCAPIGLQLEGWFDLLGTGWRLVEEGGAIAWEHDPRTVFRWPLLHGADEVLRELPPGEDIKVPWELARFQHFPAAALAARLGCEDGVLEAGMVRDTYQAWVEDFIRRNPVGAGVNWACAMEVAIRAANWVLTADLLAEAAPPDDAFMQNLGVSLLQHGRRIVSTLEWSEGQRTNHYLADLCGLAFIAAHLPSGSESDSWLALAEQELVKEVRRQFNADGSIFEASTMYHRLSAEMVVYTTALLIGLDDARLHAARAVKETPRYSPVPLDVARTGLETVPDWYAARLEKAAEFVLHVTRPDGRLPQIGDNDSGRFFKLTRPFLRMPVHHAVECYANLDGYGDLPPDADYLYEDQLDHRHLVAAINGLFERKDFAEYARGFEVEGDAVRRLSGGVILPSYRSAGTPSAAETVRIGSRDDWDASVPGQAPYNVTYEFPLAEGQLDEGLALHAYPDFGLYVMRSERLYLAVRCGSVGQDGFGGHAHNDQLSLELWLGGEPVVLDPGTFVYTSDPEARNSYRSVRAHFAPQAEDGREPGSLDEPFLLYDEAKAACRYFGPEGFIGTHVGFGAAVWRRVEILPAAVRVTDWSDEITLSRFDASAQPEYSPAYGYRLRPGVRLEECQ